MAVHLNAPLETRKIPYLFSLLMVVWIWSAHSHAFEDRVQTLSAESMNNSELREDMSSGAVDSDPAIRAADAEAMRIMRSPGFSPVMVNEEEDARRLNNSHQAAISNQLPGMEEAAAQAQAAPSD
jgi:hypothetical protein